MQMKGETMGEGDEEWWKGTDGQWATQHDRRKTEETFKCDILMIIKNLEAKVTK